MKAKINEKKLVVRELLDYPLLVMRTYTTTYDRAEAEAAMKKVNARRARLGFEPTHMRGFQKSIADGKGDRYEIVSVDGEPVDVNYEFDAIF